jgi:predicted nucleic acid-binding protein
MPTSDIPLYYWDACVPLSYINGIPDRLQHIDSMMSKSGTEFQIVTSVLSVAEVAFAALERDASELDPEMEAKIAKLWRVESPIMLVEFYELLATKAQRLIRSAVTKGWSLKPADAIHLATADQLRVAQFHTYDERLEKFSAITESKFTIGRPVSRSPHLALIETKLSAENEAQS